MFDVLYVMHDAPTCVAADMTISVSPRALRSYRGCGCVCRPKYADRYVTHRVIESIGHGYNNVGMLCVLMGGTDLHEPSVVRTGAESAVCAIVTASAFFAFINP